MDDNSGTLDADAWHASLYATGAAGNWRTKGIVTYERYDLSSRRPVEFDTQTARADYNADHVEALGELSYVQQVGANAAVEPYVSAGVSWVQVDGFTEKVNGNDYLNADQQEETWPYTLIGMRLMGAMNVGSVLVNPMLDLGWRHVFGDTDPDLVYEGLDGEILRRGRHADRRGFAGGAGRLRRRLHLRLAHLAEIQGRHRPDRAAAHPHGWRCAAVLSMGSAAAPTW